MYNIWHLLNLTTLTVGQHLQYATGLGFIILPLGRVGIYQKILHHSVKIPVSHDTACKPLTTGVTYTVQAHSQGVGAVGLGRLPPALKGHFFVNCSNAIILNIARLWNRINKISRVDLPCRFKLWPQSNVINHYYFKYRGFLYTATGNSSFQTLSKIRGKPPQLVGCVAQW